MNIKEIILQKLQQKEASCILLKEGHIVYEANGRGVAPLLYAYQSDPALLQNAFVYDKIIGKAAAILLVLGGVRGAYGEIMSESAYCYLCANGIEAQCAKRIPYIINRKGDDLCPLENSVLNIEDAQKGYESILLTIESLRSQ